MGYRIDSKYIFVLRAKAGTLGHLLRQLDKMPWDNTVRITDAHSWAHDDKMIWDTFDRWKEGKFPGPDYLSCKGAMLKVEFSALWVCDYKSLPYDWVKKYLDKMPEPNIYGVEAALFAKEPDGDFGHVFGAPKWALIATTIRD